MNSLYVLNGQTTIYNGKDKSKSWHLKLGYMSDRGLKELKKTGSI